MQDLQNIQHRFRRPAYGSAITGQDNRSLDQPWGGDHGVDQFIIAKGFIIQAQLPELRFTLAHQLSRAHTQLVQDHTEVAGVGR